MNKKVITIAVLSLVGMIMQVNNIENSLCGQFSCPTAIPRLTEWDILVKALIQVESRGDTLAVGRGNDVGALQLTPIYVADVNRILGEERYTLEDRTSLKKTLEMFKILQRHYNPERDIDVAIRLHNPRAGEEYRKRVHKYMDEIRNII